MKTQMLVLLVLFAVTPAISEGRVGGGMRSFGSRGSRGFAPRPAPSSPYRYSNPQTPNPSRSVPTPPPYQAPGGGFARGLVGGLAGGFLGSMLFRGLGFGGMGDYGGGGGMGILELLLIVGLGFFIYRWFKNRPMMETAGAGPSASYSAAFPSTQAPMETSFPTTESDLAEQIQRYDSAFDLSEFKESRTDDFFKTQACFMNQDLAPIRDSVTPEMFSALEKNLADLRAKGHINKLENIAVRNSELTETWQEYGKEFATLRLNANLLDYVVEDKTGAVVSGSKTEPVKFEEHWTFVRDMNPTQGEGRRWKLTAIENA